MSKLTTYSPKDVIVTIAGIHTVTGYVDGTFIRIFKDTKPVSTMRAMDGTVARVYSSDTMWSFELTIMQSSVTNDLLSALWNVDQVTQLGKFPIMMKDSNGSSLFLAATAWIEDSPTMTFAQNLGERTWKFGCTEVVMNVGGANPDDAAAQFGMAAGALPILGQFSESLSRLNLQNSQFQ